MDTWLQAARTWAGAIKRDVFALWIAARDPRTPLAAKLVAGAVAAYAFSPIDLVPDFVPILGLLDDLLIVPLGVMLAVRLIPAPLLAEFRDKALRRKDRPTSRGGLVTVVLIWIAISVLIGWLFWSRLTDR
ncbi:DUF1232 domain-containing protein [Fulvimarina sp. MAC3]|uniref:YkvA family protein n=1 Tax=Fulvimarina sp. MAC3 TaxID=3148887 RepID=UPI0031FD9067